MKQQRDSLFFQSQLYVAELSEPLTILQFLGKDENESQKQSSHHDKLEISNKSDKKENSNKSRHQLFIGKILNLNIFNQLYTEKQRKILMDPVGRIRYCE